MADTAHVIAEALYIWRQSLFAGRGPTVTAADLLPQARHIAAALDRAETQQPCQCKECTQ